jgi:hypothetical protein
MFYENYCDIPGYYTEIEGKSYISMEALNETSVQTSVDEEDVLRLGDLPMLEVESSSQLKRNYRRSLWLY